MARYPIYQIDFSAVSAGKHVASSKRRIKWRFGYPNEEALSSGQTGTACRGEEHDVVIIWSITSGKRQIMMDGREVHFTTNRTSVLEHSWSTRGNHVLKVVCHAAPPMTATPGFRQYDMYVDGQSFFSMPKVYELGLRAGSGARRGGGGGGGRPTASVPTPQTPQEEQEALQRAIRASLAESKAHLAEKAPAPVAEQEDLMSLGMGDPTAPAAGGYDAYGAPPAAYGGPSYGAPAPAAYAPAPAAYAPAPAAYAPAPAAYAPAPAAYSPAPAAYQQPPATPSYPTSNAGAAAYPALAASPAQDSYGGQPAYASPAPTYAAPAPAAAATNLFAQEYSSAPAPTNLYDSYATQDPFAPQPEAPPSHSQISNQILSGYGATAPGSVGLGPTDSNTPALTNGGPTENGDGGGPGLMMQFEEEEPMNPFDAALKKLVNVEHIDQPAERDLAAKKEKDETEIMKKKGKSKGLAPAAHQLVGTQATLTQISEVKGKKEPKKEIMTAPPSAFSSDAQAAGMLVVYGQSEGGNQNGPPPLQKHGGGGGFGVVYQQQQQQQAYAAQQAYYQQQQGLAPPPPAGYGGAPPPQPGYGAPPPAGYAAPPPPAYY